MALELASKSVIFHPKLKENDQIIDLVPSGVLPIPPPRKRTEGGMGVTLLGGRSMIWSFSSSSEWSMTLLHTNSSATMLSDHFYEVPGGYNSD